MSNIIYCPENLQETLSPFSVYVVNKYKTHYDIYIGRSPGGLLSDWTWGNPYVRNSSSTKERLRVIREYIKYILNFPEKQEWKINLIRSRLKGKTLGCYCSPKFCHGHILAAIANISEENLSELIQLLLKFGNENG